MKKKHIILASIAVASTALCTTGVTVAIVANATFVKNPETVNYVGNAYDDWLNEWSEDGHMYFHYNRGENAQDYDQYALWVWPYYPNSLEGTLWGFSRDPHFENITLTPMSDSLMKRSDIIQGGNEEIHVDNYGVIYDVDLTNANLRGGKTGDSVSFDGAEDIGFLLPRMDSMNGEKNWISDGGTETYIEGFTVDSSNPVEKYKNWHIDSRSGKRSFHVFANTGKLGDYFFFAGDGSSTVEPNPIDLIDNETEAQQYKSKTEFIPTYETVVGANVDANGTTPTSDEFKDVGVGYQIFVASFRDSDGNGIGDINGVREALPYLEDLGVKCIWLTPVNKSGSYHGYDVIDYKAIDKRFGTMTDFENLLDEAHERGMKVLMDLVLNHTSKSNPWFTKSKWGDVDIDDPSTPEDESFNWRDMYIWKYKTDTFQKAFLKDSGDDRVFDHYENVPILTDAESENPSWFKDGESNFYYYGKFGSGMPEINYENVKVRQKIIDTAKFWLDKGLDGYRLDAVKHIYMRDEVDNAPSSDVVIKDVGKKTSYDDEKGRYITKDYDYSSDLTKNVNWWKEFAGEIKKEYPKCFLVGENFDGWGTRTSPYYQALDSQFDFSNYYHVPAWIYNTDAGASSFDTTEENGGQAWETYNTFASTGNFNIGTTTDPLLIKGGSRPDFINGAFTSNHDVMRLINQANGLGNKNDTTANNDVKYNDVWANGKAKFQAAVTILNPGLSWIYYGDELGMSSNTKNHKAMYGSENNEDIWYRQPFLWNQKDSRTHYKSGQYTFELDDHNKHLLNNGEGVNYVPVLDANKKAIGVEKFDVSLSQFYSYFKTLCAIKNQYPKEAKIEYQYSSENVLRIHVYSTYPGEVKELVIFLNNGRNDNEYRIMLDSGYHLAGATSGAPTQNNGDIGATKYQVCAFVKGA